jgi:hypothetical protein
LRPVPEKRAGKIVGDGDELPLEHVQELVQPLLQDLRDGKRAEQGPQAVEFFRRSRPAA